MAAVEETALPVYSLKLRVSADKIFFLKADPIHIERRKTGRIDQKAALIREKLNMARRMLSSFQPFTDITDFDMIHARQSVAERGFPDTGLTGNTHGMSGKDLMDLLLREHRIFRRFDYFKTRVPVFFGKLIRALARKVRLRQPDQGLDVKFGADRQKLVQKLQVRFRIKCRDSDDQNVDISDTGPDQKILPLLNGEDRIRNIRIS